MYVFDREKSDTITSILTGASNGILMIMNVVFMYNVWSVYWRIAKLPYVQVLTIVSLVVASVDIVYRLLLLKWSVEKVIIGKNVATTSLQTGIQNTETPPINVPVYFPRWHHYEVLLIDRRRLRFLGRSYNNFPLIFFPLNIIFATHQPPHKLNLHQNHRILLNNNQRMAEELNVIHYIHDQEHINVLVE